jgi:hypothetical protein
LPNEHVSLMPAYNSVREQLVSLQAELLNILERMVVAQRRTNFWAPWCVYLHDCLASKILSGCVVAFIMFYDEVEGFIGVYTNWHESKAEIFHQVQYGELATFRELAEWVTRFAEDGVNWSNALPEVARTRAHYAPVSVINGGIFPVGTHPLLVDREFQVQYARFLADTIARCWVWTTGPQ